MLIGIRMAALATLVIVISIFIASNLEILDTCQCGQANIQTRSFTEDKLLNGVRSARGRYPWLVNLFVATNGDSGFSCGASIINDRWVLTAGHCVEGATPQNTELYVDTYDTSNLSSKDARRAKRIIQNPDYVPVGSDSDPASDLGLIELEKPLSFDRDNRIAPICILKESKPSYDNLMLAGWGLEKGFGFSLQRTNELNEGELKQVAPRKCRFPVDEENQICAGDPAGDYIISAATESGDSGSPLNTIQNGTYFQVGLTSYGAGDRYHQLVNSVGIFERPNSPQHLQWLQETIGDNAGWCKGPPGVDIVGA